MPRQRTRANGEGTVYWSTSYGRFVGQYTQGRDGEKLQRKKIYGTRGDRSRAARLAVEERLAKYVGPRRGRDGTQRRQAFADHWIENASIRSKTRQFYEWLAKMHL